MSIFYFLFAVMNLINSIMFINSARKFNILLLGHTGSGKSCFINSFLERRFAPTGNNKENLNYLPTTINTHIYKKYDNLEIYKYKNLTIQLIDTPGFSKNNLDNFKILQSIKQNLTNNFKEDSFNSILFFHSLKNNIFDFENEIKILKEVFTIEKENNISIFLKVILTQRNRITQEKQDILEEIKMKYKIDYFLLKTDCNDKFNNDFKSVLFKIINSGLINDKKIILNNEIKINNTDIINEKKTISNNEIKINNTDIINEKKIILNNEIKINNTDIIKEKKIILNNEIKINDTDKINEKTIILNNEIKINNTDKINEKTIILNNEIQDHYQNYFSYIVVTILILVLPFLVIYLKKIKKSEIPLNEKIKFEDTCELKEAKLKNEPVINKENHFYDDDDKCENEAKSDDIKKINNFKNHLTSGNEDKENICEQYKDDYIENFQNEIEKGHNVEENKKFHNVDEIEKGEEIQEIEGEYEYIGACSVLETSNKDDQQEEEIFNGNAFQLIK